MKSAKSPQKLRSSTESERVRFLARSSILDRDGIQLSGSPIWRGFLALFWVSISLYSLVAIYKDRVEGQHWGISWQLFRKCFRDWRSLLLSVLLIYAYSHIGFFYQKLMLAGWISSRNAKRCLCYRFILQNVPPALALLISNLRAWSALQTLCLIMFAMSMNMKIHSYLSTNEDLDREFHAKGGRKGTKNAYPDSVTFSDLARYLWMPTLVYKIEYPRNDTFRWGYFLERTAGIVVIFMMMYVIVEKYLHPVLVRARQLSPLDAIIELVLPCLATSLLLFFFLFEYLLNWAAELTGFADRHFYDDWWNSTDMAEFSRKWNLPVHCFLQHYIYEACLERGIPRKSAIFLTFLYSSVYHEIVLSGVAGRVRLYIFVLQMSQIPLIWLARVTGMVRYPFLANILWWVAVIVGNPLLMILYARDCY